jgi:hypothetical protein
MITLAPLPSWKSVLTSLFARVHDVETLLAPWTRDRGERAGCLSRTAWSLVLLAHWRRRQKDDGPISVWVPDYFCDSSLSLLRQLNVRLHFYPVTDKLLPDFPRLREHAKLAPPDLLLLVHYFGMPAAAAEAREFCKLEGAWLIEDAAHVLLLTPDIGEEGDFVLYSPHKLLALPDGAILVARPNGACRLGKDFVQGLGPTQQWSEQAARLLPAACGPRRLWLWTVKRCLQKLGVSRGTALGQFDDSPGETFFPPPAMSAFAQSLLRQQASRLVDVALARKRNQLLLDHLLTHTDFNEHMETMARPSKGEAVPYQASYRSAGARTKFARLRALGLPATTWPDLPAEVRADPVKHVVAMQLRESCVFLPLHQSIRGRDLSRALAVYIRVETRVSVQIQDWQGDRQAWQDLMHQAGFSNLLQSWSYGLCKSRTGAWQVKRLLLLRQGRVIGFAQVLQRQFGRLACVSRLNRGPIFLPGADASTRAAALDEIGKQLGNWMRGRVLSWAPECRVEGEPLSQLMRTSFRQCSIPGWSSSVLDLRRDEGQLRSGLAGKWRNMLNVAHRHALQAEQLDDDRIFESLLSNCAQMMQMRGVPFPLSLYRELRKDLSTEGTPGLLLALRNEEQLLAATFVVLHGNTATYLLGWSSDEGRKLHAHHMLLWENVLRLKACNIRYFDLGGIDQERTSGIAAFKLGLGGERYQLAGEGWCC